jgi:hypothetical protein
VHRLHLRSAAVAGMVAVVAVSTAAAVAVVFMAVEAVAVVFMAVEAEAAASTVVEEAERCAAAVRRRARIAVAEAMEAIAADRRVARRAAWVPTDAAPPATLRAATTAPDADRMAEPAEGLDLRRTHAIPGARPDDRRAR